MLVSCQERRMVPATRQNLEGTTLYVIATTPEGTRCAMASAQQYAADSIADVEIVLVVPRRPQVGGRFDHSDPDHAAAIRPHLALALDEGASAVVFCDRQELHDAVLSIVDRSAVVVAGGRRRGSEQRMVRRLVDAGYHAVFVPIGGRCRS